MGYRIYDASTDTHIFTEHDPRLDGFDGMVDEGVSLDSDYPEILHWPEGQPPEHWLGVSNSDDHKYCVFPSRGDCESANFTPLSTHFWNGPDWRQWEAHRFRRLPR